MNIDFDKLRIILLPHVLRGGVLLEAFLKAIYAPIKSVYGLFGRYSDKERTERVYGPSIRQLRRALADLLGVVEQLITFGEVSDRDPLALRRQSDPADSRLELGTTPLPLWSDNMVWWNREFVVNIPDAYRPGYDAEIRAVLDRWKMIGSKYSINYYTTINS